jgi:hypothetical protein
VKRPLLIVLVVAGAALLVVWVVRNTVWEDVTIPMPPKGEALTDPFYAAERFAAALGATPVRDRVFAPPKRDAVIVMSVFHWTLSQERQRALQRWVESGGQLVIDSIVGGEREFEQWSRIERQVQFRRRPKEPFEGDRSESCQPIDEEPRQPTVESAAAPQRVMCQLDAPWTLTTSQPALWALRSESGVQVLRVGVGQGSVTWINAAPFRGMKLFDGDHAWLFAAATELRRGDEVHFLSEENHASLFALIWLNGAPVVVLGLTMVALLLWRSGVRLGPLAAEEPAARRSLAEQIRGTGRFTLRRGSGAPLHAAAVRSLDEAAARHIPGYTQLAPSEQTTALAAATLLTREALEAALHHTRRRRLHELRNTLAVLETARRYLLREQMKGTHAAD